MFKFQCQCAGALILIVSIEFTLSIPASITAYSEDTTLFRDKDYIPESATNECPRRSVLPDKLIVCYADNYAHNGRCDKRVYNAAVQGCNVIIWFSISIGRDPSTDKPIISGDQGDLYCVAMTAAKLRAENVTTNHLISVGRAQPLHTLHQPRLTSPLAAGGWNAPHPDTHNNASAVLDCFLQWNREVVARPDMGFCGFDGIDWDLEGNDNASSPYNHFTLEVAPVRAVPCRAVPCRAVPCRAVPCRDVPCRAVPCRDVP
jgi:hypothetical protein